MQSNTSALHRGNQLRVTLRTSKQPRLNSSTPEQYPADVASQRLLCLQQPGTHQPWSINRESCLFIARRGFLQLDEERKALLVHGLPKPDAGRSELSRRMTLWPAMRPVLRGPMATEPKWRIFASRRRQRFHPGENTHHRTSIPAAMIARARTAPSIAAIMAERARTDIALIPSRPETEGPKSCPGPSSAGPHRRWFYFKAQHGGRARPTRADMRPTIGLERTLPRTQPAVPSCHDHEFKLFSAETHHCRLIDRHVISPLPGMVNIPTC
jgi:hypothetical protein